MKCVSGACVTVASLGLGAYHTCAVMSDGTARCWGYNPYGQLGDGTTTDQHSPEWIVTLGTSVVQIRGGLRHSCAVIADGSVKCWGDNSFGQLGDGTTTRQLNPEVVVGLGTGVVSLAIGEAHSCALMKDGSAKCWGLNAGGQLGDGSTTDRHTPISIPTLGTSVKQLCTGTSHSCAMMSDGSVRCWGDNYSGELGDGTTVRQTSPEVVTALGTGVKQVVCGGFHTCALMLDNSVRCWGANFGGQLGDGTVTDQHTPETIVALGTTVKQLAAGSGHACAVLSDGSVRCWGSNSKGSVGDGTTTDRHSPVAITLLGTGVAQITLGPADAAHSCALLTDGSVRCWGWNSAGQVGNGTIVDATSPVTPSW